VDPVPDAIKQQWRDTFGKIRQPVSASISKDSDPGPTSSEDSDSALFPSPRQLLAEASARKKGKGRQAVLSNANADDEIISIPDGKSLLI
jgi:hypothetical protein